MAEPQSSRSTPRPDADEAPAATNAEDRKTAAALSSLDARGDEDDGNSDGKGANNIDQEALGRAISRLEISVGGAKRSDDQEGDKGKGKAKGEAEKKVKIDQKDVGLLVRNLVLCSSLYVYLSLSRGK